MSKKITLTENDLFLITDSIEYRIALLQRDANDEEIKQYQNAVDVLMQSIRSFQLVKSKLDEIDVGFNGCVEMRSL